MAGVDRLRAEVASLRSQLLAVQAAAPKAQKVDAQNGCKPTESGTSQRDSTGSWQGEAHGLTKAQVERYSRQIVLPAFGVNGAALPLRAQTFCTYDSTRLVAYAPNTKQDMVHLQRNPSSAEQLSWWLGRAVLGSPAALYLAAAGVGRLGIVDCDVVETSNLHRQVGAVACALTRQAAGLVVFDLTALLTAGDPQGGHGWRVQGPVCCGRLQCHELRHRGKCACFGAFLLQMTGRPCRRAGRAQCLLLLPYNHEFETSKTLRP